MAHRTALCTCRRRGRHRVLPPGQLTSPRQAPCTARRQDPCRARRQDPCRARRQGRYISRLQDPCTYRPLARYTPRHPVRYTSRHPVRCIDLRLGRNIDLVAKCYWTFSASSFQDAQSMIGRTLLHTVTQCGAVGRRLLPQVRYTGARSYAHDALLPNSRPRNASMSLV